MSKLPQARSSRVQWDGAGNLIVSSGAIDLTTADTVGSFPFLVPFDGLITQVGFNVTEAPNNAAATLDVGKVGDVDYFINALSIATSDGGGYREVDLEDTVTAGTSLQVSRGDVIVFGTGGEASTTGAAYGTVLVEPRGNSDIDE